MRHASAAANIQDLNTLLADYQVHTQRLRGYHWNVRGPHFFELHAKFEALYDAAALHVDELAERVLALGGRPLGTLAESLKGASLTEDTDSSGSKAAAAAQDMVQRVVEDYTALNGSLRAAAKRAEAAGDAATLNLLDAMADEQEKTAWMLRAFLG